MMPPSAAVAGFLFAIALAGAMVIRLRLRRHYLVINPWYLESLQQTGLTTSQAILAVPAVIVSGHPDRNVARVSLGEGANIIRAYLKREHRVRTKERWLNALAGFGFVSKSHREAVALTRIQSAGIPCPNWIAYGQTTDGQAFLLVEALDGHVDLRDFLARESSCPGKRRRFARELGTTLAEIHNEGFDQPDLYAKHVLVDERSGGICFLDWQRSGQSRFVGWPRRYRDLAALHATLPTEAATLRERIACLRTYLEATRSWDKDVTSKQAGSAVPDLTLATRDISSQAKRLMNRRHVRQSRYISSANVCQNVIWLKGEALCVTPAFLEQLQADVPDLMSAPELMKPSLSRLEQNELTLIGNRRAHLVRRRAFRPLPLIQSWLLGKNWSSPEVRQAGLMFRLQRHGVNTPSLLAFGQRHLFPWRVESFLLTERIPNAISLNRALANQRLKETENRSENYRYGLIREAGTILQRIHAAGCRFVGQIEDGLDLVLVPQEEQSVALGRVDNLGVQRGNGRKHLLNDLTRVRDSLAPLMASRTDTVRLIRAYLGTRQLGEQGKNFCRHLMPRSLGRAYESLVQAEPGRIGATIASSASHLAWKASL